MIWLALITGAFTAGALCIAGGTSLGYTWGKADGKTGERAARAERDLRLTENRRARARQEPWATHVPDPSQAPPAPKAGRHGARAPRAATPLTSTGKQRLLAEKIERDHYEQDAELCRQTAVPPPGDDTSHRIPAYIFPVPGGGGEYAPEFSPPQQIPRPVPPFTPAEETRT